MNYNLAQPFYEQSIRNPDALALFVDGEYYSYGELAGLARRIAGSLLREGVTASGLVGILASRTIEAYAGVLGALWSGAAYVPINPQVPEDRLVRILQTTKLDALVADQAGLNLLSNRVLALAPRHILMHGKSVPPDCANKISGLSLERFTALSTAGCDAPVAKSEDSLAYILFTSGSTGTPKGVMIEAGSLDRFRTIVQKRCEFHFDDRVSQLPELSFDASVLDLFVTWGAGAGLYVVPSSQLMAPGKFIRDHALTIWHSVPSTVCLMDRMKMLKPGSFPSLRYSIFGGEALPVAAARAWQAAAPNTIVENFYGPTEVTVYCSAQRLEQPANVTRGRGTVAIGKPFLGIEMRVVDSHMSPLAAQQEGELIVTGRQVARGYLNDSDLTSARFPPLDGRRWYRTGDLAYEDASGVFHHLGRIDNQVKILGHRVELEDIEAHMREVTRTDLVAAVAWPLEDGRPTGLVAFHCSPGISRDEVRDALQKRVPGYMVPQVVHCLARLPLGATGKIDRKALLRMLEEGGLDISRTNSSD